jgi:hypothetical protein
VATSVATVSLMEDSGRPVQTIYRVIEKTIDRVADIPAVKEIVKPDTAPAVTELSPSDIVDKKTASLVRVYEKVGDTKQFVALGVALGTKDALLTSALSFIVQPDQQFVAITSSNREIPLKFEKSGLINNFSLFTFVYNPNEKTKVPALTLRNISGVKLGSNVVAFGGKENGNMVSTGIVTEVNSMDGSASSTKNLLSTDIMLSSLVSGWLLFDTTGNLVAFERGIDETDKTAVFLNAKLVEEGMVGYL